MQQQEDADRALAVVAATERTAKLTIGGFAAVLLICIVLSIHLSTLGLSFGSLLYGSSVLWRGHNASFRLAALEPRSMTLVPEVVATVTLRDSRGTRLQRRSAGVGLAEVTLEVPTDLETHPVLSVELRTPAGTDTFDVALRAVSEPGAMLGRVASHSESLVPDAQTPTGHLRIAAYPAAGRVVAGLQNRVDARITTAEGAPFAGPLSNATLALQTESDPAGLFSFTYRPPPKPETLLFTVGSAPAQTVPLPLGVQAAQLILEATPRALIEPGGLLDLKVTTLPFTGPVHLDVWIGSALVLSTSEPAVGGLRELEVGLPEEVSGFVRVDAYRNFMAAEDSLCSALLWVHPGSQPPPEPLPPEQPPPEQLPPEQLPPEQLPPEQPPPEQPPPEQPPSEQGRAQWEAEAATAALQALRLFPGGDPILDAAAAADPSTRSRLVELAASRFVPQTAGIPLLRSTLEAREAAVQADRTRLRGHLNTLFALTLALGLGLAVAWSIHHHIAVKRAVRGVVEEGIAAGEAIDAEGMARLVRLGQLYDLGLALGALVLAGYSIYVLLARVHWG